ncbi:hypothetical protein VMCG_00372 [Cytospora schulzeri]|uniref:Zn(2)-C6 fungal-type domain-containing protein n=1 Tax=Cytospora schulzeri TaxID=448051 RepID=A0A423X9K4_9PEZI|nr:hypothetical protein VMCG_00372 [Valsa malicola]
MVYCGKPSKGCVNCRERKIRCDQRQPGCGQCEKRQKQCSGYRNLVDLMFRDESSHVINKARKKRTQPPLDKTAPSRKGAIPTPTASQPSSIGSDSSTSPEQLSWTPAASSASIADPCGQPDAVIPLRGWSPAQSPPTKPLLDSKCDARGREVSRSEHRRPPLVDASASISYSLSPSLQERGINLFVARYITVSENLSHHRYDFVLDLWKPNTSEPEHDPVLAGITAVGLVGVAEMNRSDAILNAARQSYGKALCLTNAALRDPGEAVKDTTMLSVLVLGLFEMIGGSRTRGIEAWQKHINGATALARLRGMPSFRTPAGMRMFFMLTQNTMIACIQNELPMPEDLLKMRDEVGSMLRSRSSGYEICSAMYKILQLRYDIKQGSVTDLDEMLDLFTDVEDDFEKAISLFPEAWQYRKCRLTQQVRPGFFDDVYHVYPNLRVARIWNGPRTCRLLILETMVDELRRRFSHVPVGLVPKRYQTEYRKANFKMERTALAILASVPQHFDLTHDLGGAEYPPLSPAPSPDDSWPQVSESNGAAELGSETETPDLGGAEDEEQCCQSPSLSNFMHTEDDEVRAERFMLLSSVTNSIVWPLYLVGVSSASSAPMKAFVVERLHAVYKETGVLQARDLANFIATHMQSTAMSGKRASLVKNQ